jgi:hypothetical protein
MLCSQGAIYEKLPYFIYIIYLHNFSEIHEVNIECACSYKYTKSSLWATGDRISGCCNELFLCNVLAVVGLPAVKFILTHVYKPENRKNIYLPFNSINPSLITLHPFELTDTT